ncbi:uncharacterized protein LOC119672290 [Teleopsis dalmanni]|uniref:uncharacterized protein LOC119672290 n=1 Tax=Teleopsis dalmanni TaxID=139649 RepID=UPI0018CD6574|nr:uncharacterized protein LOC119672290 [Teleopsis dalmanni]
MFRPNLAGPFKSKKNKRSAKKPPAVNMEDVENESDPFLKKVFKVESCVCDRPSVHLVCLNCGTTTYGRIQMLCPKHRNVQWLMDFGACPKCNADKSQIKEYNAARSVRANNP